MFLFPTAIFDLLSTKFVPKSKIINRNFSSFEIPKKIVLGNIRSELIRLEETVIFALIERAQFPINADIYTKPLLSSSERRVNDNGMSSGGASSAVNSTSMPYLDYFLHQTEMVEEYFSKFNQEKINVSFAQNHDFFF